MNIKEIIVSWLQKNGYDGLYNIAYDCSCDIKELNCCGCQFDDCIPGVKVNIEYDEAQNYKIIPRQKKQPAEVCKELSCSGVNDKCPGNTMCPAVKFSCEKPVDCAEAVAYMKQQIDLSRRCSFCHGENSIKCDHCRGTGKEPEKLLDKN